MTDAVSDARSLPPVPGLPRDGLLFQRVAVGLRPPVLAMLNRLLSPPPLPDRRRYSPWGPLASLREKVDRLWAEMRDTGPPLPVADLDRLMRPPAVDEKRLRAQWGMLDVRLRYTELRPAEMGQLLTVQAAFADRWAGVADTVLSRHLPRWLRPRRKQVDGYYMPPPAWGLVAGLAWDDLDFRHAVAALIQGFLRENYLIIPGQMPVPRLAPETCWLLLAAVGPRPRRWWWPQHWFPSTRRARRLEQMITALIPTTPDWAGFWDWWVLRRLLTHLPDLPARFGPELAASLAAVPPPLSASLSPIPNSPASIGG
ncbi:hypothetical protein GE253_12650 [Niveispirillum sp. SYP-B3756]|uniref:hypothetical protein n=1 Tax=Niveispirillum sp. SYP-B3756 TaxID=2662178 RepID=UPI001290D665|nr:hypothetical protein [Niveispirillum sp. SYP-B3756]MQP66191.1 hypothetical protein [Niveispirillum sp. SYP-B3756]